MFCKVFFWFVFVFFTAFCAADTVSAHETEKIAVRIGYIEPSFSPSERQAFQETFDYLRAKFPAYDITTQVILVRNLETAIAEGSIDYFIGASGQFRRMLRRGVGNLATLTTPTAPNPNLAIGTVFMVLKDSLYQTIDDLKETRAAVNWEGGFSGFHVPLGEVAARGYNPDRFFKGIVAAGSPMKRLLEAVERGEADVALARACTVEELMQTEPEYVAKFRPIGLKPATDEFACMHSTELYPNWTFSSAPSARWDITSNIAGALLMMPKTSNGMGWAVVSDYNKVDNLLRTLKIGPFRYLRVESLQDFINRYRVEIFFCLMLAASLALHSWRTSYLVRLRTRELGEAVEKEFEALEIARRAEDRLQAFEKVNVVGAMSSLITHEINGPLSAITNTCRALSRHFENEGSSPFIDNALALIDRQCSKAARIVSTVRNYVRSRDVDVERIDVNRIIGRIVANFRNRSGLDIVFEASGDNPAVCLNMLEFELCVNNMLKNAVEAVKEHDGKSVTVSVGVHEIKVEIRVLDDACVSVQEIEDAANPLHSGKCGGPGLGLLIVRTIAEKAGGHFSLKRLGTVTTAILLLPIYGVYVNDKHRD